MNDRHSRCSVSEFFEKGDTMSKMLLRRRGKIGLNVTSSLLLATAAFSATSLGAGASTTASSAGPVRIAVIAAATGADSPVGRQIIAGVRVAASILNAQGGVAGHKVQVTYQDTHSNSSVAVAELRRVARAGINLVVGATNDQACAALLPVARKLGVTMVSPTCQADTLTGSHPAADYFQVAPNYTDFAVGTDILVFRADATIKTFVVTFPDTPVGHSIERRVEETLHYTDTATVVKTIYVAPTASMLTSYVSEIESAGGKSVGLVSFTSGSALIDMMKSEVVKDVPTHYGEDWASASPTTVLHALGSRIPNMWLSYTYYYGAFHNSVNAEFVSRFKALEAHLPTPVNEMAYVAVQAMAAGILKSHSMGATTVAEAMAGVSVSSPEGNVTVNATTHLVGQGMLALHVEPTSTGVQVVKVIDIPFTTFNYSS